MRIKSIYVRGVRSIADQKLDDLPALAFVIGPNSAGKSNLAHAVRVFLSIHAGGVGPSKSDVSAYQFVWPPRVELEVVPTPEERRLVTSEQFAQGVPNADPAALKTVSDTLAAEIRAVRVGVELVDAPQPGQTFHAQGYGPWVNGMEVSDFVRRVLHGVGRHGPVQLQGVNLQNLLPNLIQANILRALVAPRIRTLGPMRNPRPRFHPIGTDRFAPDAADLGNAVFLESSNRTPAFRQLESWFREVFPEATDILAATPPPRLSQGNELRLGIRETEISDMVPAEAMSSGMLEALSILSLIAFSPEGSFILLEEPEAHFHGSALRELMRIIREQSRHRQFLVITHSEAVVGVETEMSSVWMARREEGKGTKFTRGAGESDADLMHRLLNERPARIAREGEGGTAVSPVLLGPAGV